MYQYMSLFIIHVYKIRNRCVSVCVCVFNNPRVLNVNHKIRIDNTDIIYLLDIILITFISVHKCALL